MGYFALIAGEIGIPVWLLLVLVVWGLTWKLIALWKSARKGSLIWFIAIALINTLGALEILYIFIFSESPKRRKAEPSLKKKSSRKR